MPNRNITMIIDEGRVNTTWHKKDIYTGTDGTGRYVPNVDDLVYDYETGFYKVIAVNYNSGLSTLIPWNFQSLNGGITNTDVITGGGPGIGSEFFRMYVNTGVVPYEFSIDTRLKLYGSKAAYIKVFKEGEINEQPISIALSNGGQVVSENIRLENVVLPNIPTQNHHVKVPVSGHLSEKLYNGDVVSVVVYSSSGAVLSIFKLVVVITNFVRTINDGKKLITDITLISPYLNPTDNRLLEYPANIIIDSTALTARVSFNDGSSETYPVDGRKFKLMGTQNFVASQIGQTVPLVLSYTLANDEFGNNINQVGNERFLTKSYRLKTIDSDAQYSVKLFCCPVWNFSTNKWDLTFYLLNLDRDIIFNVTRLVEHQTNNVPFDGTQYGSAQNVTVAVNLDTVSNNFKYYRHVTDFTVTLHRNATANTTAPPFTIGYDNDSVYGNLSVATVTKSGNRANINLSGGRANITEWLEVVYHSTDPLYFPYVEPVAPTPSHVKILIGDNWQREIPLGDVLNPIAAEGINNLLVNGRDVRLEFLANYNNKRMILATTNLICKIN